MDAAIYNWQQKGWPKFTFNRALLADELAAFAEAFRKVKAALRHGQDPELVARTLTDEAVVTSRIEGVTVDESVVMSSICKALGVAYAPTGFTKDVVSGAGPQTRYRLAFELDEPIEGINEGIKARIERLVRMHPGTRVPYLHSVVSSSKATVERVLAALIAEGRIEHRGSRKTGGYYGLSESHKES